MTNTDTLTPDGQPCPRLLIVEDDDLIAELLAEALAEHYEVRCVRTGAQARSVLLAGGVDALLSDYHLLDGPAAPVLREADRSGVPTLVMTGDPEFPAGDRSMLAKPFDMVELLLALERVLDTPGGLGRRGRVRRPTPFRPGLRFVVGREVHEGHALAVTP